MYHQTDAEGSMVGEPELYNALGGRIKHSPSSLQPVSGEFAFLRRCFSAMGYRKCINIARYSHG